MGNKYRPRPQGFYTERRRGGGYVKRPITPRRGSRQTLPRLYVPQQVQHIQVPKRLFNLSINRIFTAVDVAFPTFMPIIETGRVLINNKDLLGHCIKILFSNKNAEMKLDAMGRELIKHIEAKLTSEFSKNSATTISNLMDEQGCFDLVSKEITNVPQKTDAGILKKFFESTLEGLVNTSISGALGIGK